MTTASPTIVPVSSSSALPSTSPPGATTASNPSIVVGIPANEKAPPPQKEEFGPPHYELKYPRLVQIGLNLIALHEVNDKEHSFRGNILLHVFWDARPLEKGKPYFKPWIQLHNVRQVHEIFNEGMARWTKKELAERVKEARKDDAELRNPINVMETRNFVAEFVSTLELKYFPFDQQNLKIVIMSNPTALITLTHKVARDMKTFQSKPIVRKQRLVNAIKCNLEADTLSEWDVLLADGKKIDSNASSSGESKTVPAVAIYKFREHDREFSTEGAIYQRMDFFVVAQRELKNIMWAIVLPSFMLSFSSLSVFSLSFDNDMGNRFSILFTVILTIVASQFSTQDRLPRLAYFTWIDYALLSYQCFVYLIVIETALIPAIAYDTGLTIDELDLYGFYFCLCLFGVITLTLLASGTYLIHIRNVAAKTIERESFQCFDLEEERLFTKVFKHPELYKVADLSTETATQAAAQAAISASHAHSSTNLTGGPAHSQQQQSQGTLATAAKSVLNNIPGSEMMTQLVTSAAATGSTLVNGGSALVAATTNSASVTSWLPGGSGSGRNGSEEPGRRL